MADNVTADSGSGGAVFATDDIGGVHYPIGKITFGALDSQTIASSNNGTADAGTQRVTIASDSTGQIKLAAGTAEIGKLAAGTAAIGKLAANSGVDIGDVGATGNVAHDAVDSGNPLKIGGKANSAEPTAVAAGDRVDAWLDRYGRLVVILGHPDPEPPATSTLTNTTEATVIAAPGASQHLYIKGVQAGNGSTTVTRLDLKEGASGTVRKSMPLAISGGGFTTQFDPPWQIPANTALVAQLSATPSGGLADVRVNIDYYIAPDA